MVTLSACGGSGGGIVTTPPPVSTPGPTPAPAPAPTPTPTPPAYTKFADLTGDQDFQNAAAEQRSVTDINGQRTDSFALANFGSGITFTYDSVSDSYTLTQADGITSTFGPSSLQASSTADLRIFQQLKYPNNPNSSEENFRIVAPLINGVALSYTRIGEWFAYNTADFTPPFIRTGTRFVAGVPTVASDMPTSGSATYSSVISSGFVRSDSNAFSLSDSTATFDANFLNGTINTSLSLNALDGLAGSNPFSLGTVTGIGMVNNGTSSFDGDFTASGIFTNGEFSGSFFGPAALEFGYVFILNGNGNLNGTVENFSIYGAVAGAKGP